jgi:hypothetical protein
MGRTARRVVLTALWSPAGRRLAAASSHVVDGDGVHIEPLHEVDARQLAVRFDTATLEQPVGVRTLLPRGRAGTPRRNCEVRYRCRGISGRASDSADGGNAEAIPQGAAPIVGRADAGLNGLRAGLRALPAA